MSLRETYDRLVDAGTLEHDDAQEALIGRLERLERAIVAQEAARMGFLSRFLRSRHVVPDVKGLYIHGAVGRGKSMLMDLFFAGIEHPAKRRAHFHDFMADVHERIHAERQRAKETGGGDPIGPVANALADEARLLCFDEFSVTDIADAMILGRLFTVLFERGVVLVATSNTAPENLYHNGLNRQLFLPFIELLANQVDVFELDARTDFRLEKLAGAPVYHVPADARARKALNAAFERLSGVKRGEPAQIPAKGRSIAVPQAHAGVARFSFDELCDRPLGAADYIRVARAYHTIIVDTIPVLDPPQRNQARRLVWLIDALYERKVKLIASAEAEPHELYVEGDFANEFERTASRMIEMRGQDYLAAPHGGEGGDKGPDSPIGELEHEAQQA